MNNEIAKTILESITDAFFLLDKNWNFIYLNKRSEQLLERKVEDLLYKNVWEEFREAVNTDFYKFYHQAVEKNESINFEAFYPPLNRWFLVNAYPSTEGLSVYYTDITQQKNLENEIKSINRKLKRTVEKRTNEVIKKQMEFKEIFDFSIDAIAYSDLKGKLLNINPAFEKLVGYTKQEILKMNFRDLTPDEFIEEEERHLEKLLKDKSPIEYEKEYIAKSGKRIKISVSVFLIKDITGKETGFGGIVRDITEKKRLENILLESEKRYKGMVESLNDGVVLQDSKGEIIDYNKSAEQILEIKNNSRGKKYFYNKSKIIHEDNTVYAPKDYPSAKALETGKNQNNVLMGVKVKDKIKWLNVNAEPIFNPNETYPSSVITSFSDITYIKEKENDIHKYSMELKRSNEELQHFASIASHDLQEPLRKIQAFGSRLIKDYSDVLDQNGLDYLKRMINASDRMYKFIYDLLDYSRVTTRAIPFERINLRDIIQDILSDYELKIDSLNAKISYDELATIYADPVQMRQLFQNLISNALKFHKEDIPPKIDITTKYYSKEKIYEFKVKDNGIGFKAEYADKIFLIFQRLHTAKEYEGSGIGLSICKKIIERHNGSILVESMPMVGTTFTVKLPQKPL